MCMLGYSAVVVQAHAQAGQAKARAGGITYGSVDRSGRALVRELSPTTIPKVAHPGNCPGCGAPLRRDHGCNHCGRGEE